jgi:hypothetical protein
MSAYFGEIRHARGEADEVITSVPGFLSRWLFHDIMDGVLSGRFRGTKVGNGACFIAYLAKDEIEELIEPAAKVFEKSEGFPHLRDVVRSFRDVLSTLNHPWPGAAKPLRKPM